LVSKIYYTPYKPTELKALETALVAKPRGKLQALKNNIKPGPGNSIEGRFLDKQNSLQNELCKSKSTRNQRILITTIIMVLNLVKITKHVSY
jgi:hypothetical protein